MKEDIENQSNNLSPNNVYNDIKLKFNYFSKKKNSVLKKEISNYLIGKYIFTSYSKIIQVYQIIGLSFDKNPVNTVLTFNKEGNEKVSFSIKKYFEDEYNIIIKDDTQPLLFCKKIKHRVSKGGSNRRRKRNK